MTPTQSLSDDKADICHPDAEGLQGVVRLQPKAGGADQAHPVGPSVGPVREGVGRAEGECQVPTRQACPVVRERLRRLGGAHTPRLRQALQGDRDGHRLHAA
ncbi:MAG: hypothetical protein Q4D30_01215 [Bacteroidales bacterium]|nr:hypothetical protein [Bacteroidales bacterium]